MASAQIEKNRTRIFLTKDQDPEKLIEIHSLLRQTGDEEKSFCNVSYGIVCEKITRITRPSGNDETRVTVAAYVGPGVKRESHSVRETPEEILNIYGEAGVEFLPEVHRQNPNLTRVKDFYHRTKFHFITGASKITLG